MNKIETNIVNIKVTVLYIYTVETEEFWLEAQERTCTDFTETLLRVPTYNMENID